MTNNKQQTAVEWFLIECGKYGDTAQIPDEVIEQAKEMEKKQIINSFGNGDNTDCTSEQNIEEFAEQYYNETFGGGEL